MRRGLVQMMPWQSRRGGESARRGRLAVARERSPAVLAPRAVRAWEISICSEGKRRRQRDVLLEAKGEAEALGHATGIRRVGLSGFRVCPARGYPARVATSCGPARPAPSRRVIRLIEALALFSEAEYSIASRRVRHGGSDRVSQASDRNPGSTWRPSHCWGWQRELLARLLAASGRTVRGAGRTWSGDRTVCAVKNDCSTGTC